MASTFDNMLAFHRTLHERIIEEFKTISEAELNLPSTFWEETRFPIEHHVHRYESHFAQHINQIDKTLVAIRQAPTESKRLLRKIYAAIRATASSISEPTKEIRDLP